MGKIIEGRWDCPYCDAVGIKGSVMNCPSCGKSRGEDIKFYIGDPKDYTKNKVVDSPDWLCSYCDTYNSATTNICRSCGHNRDGEDRDYHKVQKDKDKDYKEITNKYVSSKYTYDDTWICPSCGTLNKESEYKCKSCGGFREKKKESFAKSVSKKGYDYKENPYRESNSKSRSFDYNKNTESVKFLKKNSKILTISVIVIALLVILLVLLLPNDATFGVTDSEWNYKVNVEEYKTFDESGWSLPSGARLHYTRLEISHYRSELDHYETKTRQVSERVLDGYDTVVVGHRDMGNGYFEEITRQEPRYRTEYRTETYQEPVYVEVPVYDTKYYYEIDRWVYTRSVMTSGRDKSPYFGEVVLGEKERIRDREETYYLYGFVKNKYRELEVTKEIWEKYDKGDDILVRINNLGIITIKK